MGVAGGAVLGAADGDPRHLRRERRASRYCEGSADRPRGSELDDHELFADLREPASAGRPRGRSARAPSGFPYRSRRVHGRVAWLGAGRQRRGVVRRPGRTGTGSGASVAGGPVDHHHAVQGPRARTGTRGLGCCRRRRRRGRRAAWRLADPADRLAGDLLHQPADRPDRRRGRRARGARGRRPASLAAARSARRIACNGELRRAGVRSVSGAECGLGLDADPRAESPPDSLGWSCSGSPSGGPRCRC